MTQSTDITRTEYFDRLTSSSLKVDEKIKEIVNKSNSATIKNLQNFFKKRIGKQKMRPFLTELTYELTKKTNQEDRNNIKIAKVISEINSYHLYTINWIIDNKNGIFQKKNCELQQHLANITLAITGYQSLTHKLITQLDIPNIDKFGILKQLNTQNLSCYDGQHKEISMNINSINNYKSDSDYIKAYTSKAKHLSGEAYGFSAYLGGKINKTTPAIIQNLHNFGTQFGTALHISNDLSEYAPAQQNLTFKTYSDHMRDLMNGRLTAPIYYILKHGTLKEKDAILTVYKKKQKSSKKELLNVSKAIINSGAYDFSFKIIKKEYNKTKKILKSTFEEQGNNKKNKKMLSIMTSIIRSNKSLGSFKKLQ